MVYLGLVLLLLRPLQLLGYMIAVMGMSLAGALYLGWAVREYIRPGIVPASYREHWPEIKRYVINTGALALFTGMAALVEPWTIRNFTPPMDSAGFYMAFMFGQIPLYVTAAFLPFLFSLISERHERGQRTEALLAQSLVAMAATGVPLVILFVLFGDRLMNLRPSWSQYAAYSPLLWKVAAGSTLQGVISAYVSHENACQRFKYVRFFLPVLAVEMAVLYVCMGWGFFQSRMALSVWETVDRMLGSKIEFAVWVMLGARLLLALPVFGHVMRMRRRTSSAEGTN